MRCTIGSVLLCVATTIAGLQAQDVLGGPRDLNRRGGGVSRLERWVSFVQAHRGGAPDSGTHQLDSWTTADLDELTIDLPSLLKLMDDPRGDEFSVWIEGVGRNAGRRRVVYSGSELDRLRRMARAIGGRVPQAAPAPREEARILAAQNRLLKRGAVLHTTTALTRPERTDTAAPGGSTTRWDGVVQFDDGRQLGVDNRSNHWKFARRLLNMVMPKPSSDSAVLDWYRASSSVLLRDFQMHADHFDQALRLFPDDPLLLMFAGTLHEDLASARVQEFIRSAVVPPGVTLKVGSSKTELERAEVLLRRSVKIDPRAPDARVRLGRVLSLQTRYADALTELRQLDASAPPMLQYYAALFTGDAAEALGRRDEARIAYEHALQLYPHAQAPRLGLSQLAASAGASTQAVSALTPVFSGTRGLSSTDDPYWTYHLAAGRETDALLARAYRALSEAGSR